MVQSPQPLETTLYINDLPSLQADVQQAFPTFIYYLYMHSDSVNDTNATLSATVATNSNALTY